MNSKTWVRMILLSAALGVSGCQNASVGRGAPVDAMMIDMPVAAAGLAETPQSPGLGDVRAGAAPADPSARLLARTGRLSVSVLDLPAAADRAQAALRELGGYVQARRDQSDYRIQLTLKVPAAKFDGLMAACAALGQVDARQVEVADVTEEYVDIDARITGLTALRDKLRGLLDKAQNVPETLEVERELSRVQTELESLQGRMKALRARIDLSTLDLTLTRNHPRREQVRGPLGFLLHWTWVGVEKLFIWREAE